MRKVFVFLWMVASNLAYADDYTVRNIDTNSEKFDRIYNSISPTVLGEPKMGNPPDDRKFHTVEIVQHLEKSFYLVSVGDETFAMDVPGDRIYPDGETLSLPVAKSDEVYQYVSVAGAKRTVARLVSLPKPKPRLIRDWRKMTKGEFVDALKNGATYKVQTGSKIVRCSFCSGFGTVNAGAAKKKCPKCKDSPRARKRTIPVYTTVKW